MSGDAVALLSAVLWSVSNVWMAMGIRRLPVISMNLIRCISSSAFFLCLLPFFGGFRALAAVAPGTLLWLALSVLMLLIVGDLLYFRSLDMAGVSWAMPVASINPLWAVLLAALFVNEPLTWRLMVGAILIVAGIILVGRSSAQDQQVDRRKQRLGLLLALLASLSWGIGQVVLKVATEHVDPVVANSIRQPMGMVAMLGLNLVRGRWTELRTLDGRSWLLIVFASLVGTGLGSLLFVQAIQMVGAGRTAVLTSTSPLLAIPFAVLWLHERPSRNTLIGALLAVGGIALVA